MFCRVFPLPAALTVWVFVLALTALLLWVMGAVRHRPTVLRMLGVGLVLGLLALSRENALIFVPIIMLWAATLATGASDSARSSRM